VNGWGLVEVDECGLIEGLVVVVGWGLVEADELPETVLVCLGFGLDDDELDELLLLDEEDDEEGDETRPNCCSAAGCQ
jgi:hypothetical protein